ncbi:MAG TPA: aminodeoxychorismate/anthranilate synthase component II [Ruminococcaceae bacterium]|nr:aminodeoxychorismate/anthranilate synthase component II [Oscillospiraceae bacterium]
MILILDNYDSFSYNLYQLFGSITPDVKVIRSDKITVEEIEKLHPSHLVLSPGPGFPKDAGICIEALLKLKGKLPILGVCLGHQAIGEAFGGKVVHAPQLMHGKTSEIHFDSKCPIFAGLPAGLHVMRYHSLIVDKATLPACLRVTAIEPTGEIMGFVHRQYPIYGVQFHPESFMTEGGMTMLQNFYRLKV